MRYDESNPMSVLEQWMLIDCDHAISLEDLKNILMEHAMETVSQSFILEAIK